MTKLSQSFGSARLERTLTLTDLQELIDQAGGTVRIVESLRKSEENHRYLERNYQRLLERYPNRFVVVLDCKVVGTGKNLRRLFARLRGKGLDLSTAKCQYLDPNPRKLILLKRIA